MEASMFRWTESRRHFLKGAGLAGLALLSDLNPRRGLAQQPVVRVRKGIDEFARDATSLQALRDGVKKMRELPPDHPFSWIFQANIHWRPFYPDYVYTQAEQSTDPAMRLFRDKTGFTADPDVFNQCPHGNWWFPPWHRAYLYFFERILRWASNNPDLALPYWNYSDPGQRELPAVYRQPTFRPTGAGADEDNPLYLPDGATFQDGATPQVFPMRDNSLNTGLTQLTESATSLAALSVVPFTTQPPAPASGGFGSPHACSLTCGCGSGAVERVPHNVVHNAIGGNAVEVGRSLRVGFMGDVATA